MSARFEALVEQDFDRLATLLAENRDFFTAPEVVAARAPGRLDVMGGIADYSGSLVAEMPIAQAALAAVQVGGTESGAVIVRSPSVAAAGYSPEVTLPGELFVNPVSLLKWLRESPKSVGWAGYVAGCLSILRAEGLVPRGAGARIFVTSDVPIGAGVSSSAAIEVATMRALCAAFGVSLTGLELARYCQRVENEIVDAPCGIMDQVTSACGEAGKLLLLLCQPATIQGTTTIPSGWSAVGIDSGVKHSVAGAGYTGVRVAAFMGAKILADLTGEGFGGYLCNVTPERYESLGVALPETMTGAEFLAKHGGILDSVTRVETATSYPVRAATEHPIYENARVRAFVALLADGSESALTDAGKQMLAAHESYSRCGLGTAETDLLVALAMDQPGVVGAKITGGGSGGTVCILCRTEVEDVVIESVTTAYTEKTGITPRVIRGTSPGAFATEIRSLTLAP